MAKILVIDNEKDIRTIVSASLSRQIPDCTAITAGSGIEGIEKAKAESPDTILLDIAMPGIDGFETCRRLKVDEGTMHIPIIMVTGVADDSQTIADALNAGADVLLSKPVEDIELIAQVNAALRIKKAEDALRKRGDLLEGDLRERTRDLTKIRETYRAVLEGIEDGYYEVDLAGSFIFINDAMCRISEFSRDELMGMNYLEYVDKGDSGELYKVFNRVYTTGSSVGRFEWEVIAKGGSRKNMEGSISLIKDAHGRTEGFRGVIRDITKSRRADRELKKAHERLESSNMELISAYSDLKSTQSKMLQSEKLASIGQLAAGVAHEINNPMGFISSNLGTLDKYVKRLTEFIQAQAEAIEFFKDKSAAEVIDEKKKGLKIDYIIEDTKDLIAESLEGAGRVKKIVQNLKSFSRIDEEDYKYADINECLETTINIIWNELKYKCTVTKEYKDLPFTKCYPQQLNQVFMNLLMNAAQAIEKKGEIAIKTWQENGLINISVSDTGCGIPEENLRKLFDPFFTTKEIGKGTGLGLSISYDIVKKHGGEIAVESEAGKGTTFTIRMPVKV